MAKINFKKLIDMVKSHEYDLTTETSTKTDEYRALPIFAHLNLTDAEFNKYGQAINQIINEEKLCAKNPNGCFSSAGMHLRLERNNRGELELNTVPCEKIKKSKASMEHLKNFLLEDFSEEMKILRLSKKFFSGEVDPSVSSLIQKYIAMAKNPKNIEHGLYIHGDMGVGKTYSSVAFANELARAGNKVAFVFVPDVVYSLKQGFDQDSKINGAVVKKMKNADVLFLDDIGAEEASLWFYNELLLIILNHRMQNKKPTFFISNLSMDELSSKLNKKQKETVNVKRLLERIRTLTKNTEHKINGKNRRY